eukprot:gnl/Hemi2/972_TR351_c0_g1_i1.p1 gnl/Hemi2/972_TR351_c0_g1~~gnl/Hemi2/972_TR351_c0_g1_i1.p1  ORF type:complete len:288 (-),score=55.81 gnl/Hemi2/972_TR351_c0_g1_i1:92-955(-)
MSDGRDEEDEPSPKKPRLSSGVDDSHATSSSSFDLHMFSSDMDTAFDDSDAAPPPNHNDFITDFTSFHNHTTDYYDEEFSEEDIHYLQLLRRFFQTEKHAPDLLAFQDSMVDKVKGCLDRQENKITRMRNSGDVTAAFFADFYEMEVDRVKYMLRSYYRARLAKIEQFCLLLNTGEHQRVHLHIHEQNYAVEFAKLLTQLFNNCFMTELVGRTNAQFEMKSQMDTVPVPDISRFVVVRPLESLGLLDNPDSDDPETDAPVELGENHTIVIRYSRIRTFVAQDKVCLI